MVEYKKTTWKKRIGDYDAVIKDVIVEPNQYYESQKAKNDNATENVLTLVFDCTDFVTGEMFEQRQRFVSPLTGGTGLFQQLLDVVEFIPDENAGSFDEQKLVGLGVIINIGEKPDKNDPNKIYPDVKKITKKPTKRPVAAKPKTALASEVENNLPF